MLPAAQSTKHLYYLQPFFAAGSSVPMSAGDSLLLVEFIDMTIIFGCHVSPRLHLFAILTLIGRGECLWWEICHCVASVGILCLTLHFSVDGCFFPGLSCSGSRGCCTSVVMSVHLHEICESVKFVLLRLLHHFLICV